MKLADDEAEAEKRMAKLEADIAKKKVRALLLQRGGVSYLVTVHFLLPSTFPPVTRRRSLPPS